MRGFVAVHAGAGLHAESDRNQLMKLCKSACSAGLSILKNVPGPDNELAGSDKPSPRTPLLVAHSCLQAACVLENSPLTNAGLGSNLNRDGRVECDAGLMLGDGMEFAGVGSLPGVMNPIKVPYEMIRLSMEASESPTIPPLLLCGSGAMEFARQCSIEIVDENSMKTSKSVSNLIKCSKILTNWNKADSEGLMDTVGCIVVDEHGCTAACCSSGGVLLKLPGRVGQAACYGAGCWAEDTGPWSIAVSVSGCGETLIRTRFAQRCAENIFQTLHVSPDTFCLIDALQQFFVDDYLNSKFLKNFDLQRRKIAGAIVALVEKSENAGKMVSVEFAYVHNSDTMCVGFTPSDKTQCKAQSIFSRSDNGKVVIGGSTVR